MFSFGHRSNPPARVPLSVVPSQGRFSISDQTVVVRLAGELTAASRASVRSHLLPLVGPGGPLEIVLDLSRVSSIDDAGVRPLLEAHRLQVARGGGLHLGLVSRTVAIHLYADPPVADALMPQFAIDHPYHWAAEARWFDAGIGPGSDGAA